jgi:YbgC/YbaW family acyl-CoA thioester hydrolase
MKHVFTMTRQVAFSETDMAGVMHFSNYLRWMEDVEHAFWRSLGISVTLREGAGHISWPRVAVGCEYYAPLRFEDTVTLVFKLTNVGEKSLSHEVEFVREGQRVALGRTTAVCCELSGGTFRSIAIPDSIRERLRPLVPPEVEPA